MADRSDNDDHGKVSDSAYSNSRSNSQSRRSYSSQSATHSGSNSSGSSGYSGNPSSTEASKNHRKRNKLKNAKQTQELTEKIVEESKAEQTTEVSSDDERSLVPVSNCRAVNNVENTELPDEAETLEVDKEHFACLVSTRNGTIVCSTMPFYNILGYPKEMWVGRSFIDFIHPRDQRIFAAQISDRQDENVLKQAIDEKFSTTQTIFCRLRSYNGLMTTGFTIKPIMYLPFKLLLTFQARPRNIASEDNAVSTQNKEELFIMIKATVVTPAYRESIETLSEDGTKAFLIRHSSLGVIEHAADDSVAYLGYMPHDLVGRCAIKLYHPEDLSHMRRIYEKVVKFGQSPTTILRILTQNADYVKVEAQLSCFVNPWSRKLEYVTGQYRVIQGPCNPDIFRTPEIERSLYSIQEVRINAEAMRNNILRTMNDLLTKSAETAKYQVQKKCENVTSYMEEFIDTKSQFGVQNGLETSLSEKDCVLVGGMSPHYDYCDSNSASSDTAQSYNQLNYKHNLQRFFDSYPLPDTQNKINDAAPHPEFKRIEKNRATCLSPSASCITSPVIMESDDFDGPPCHDSQNQARLTEDTLKKHEIEMVKIFTKQHRDSRVKGEKKTMSRQRIEHLARCNKFHEQNVSANYGLFSPFHSAAPLPHGSKRDAARAEIAETPRVSKQSKPIPPEPQQTALDIPHRVAPPNEELWAGHSISNICMQTNTFVNPAYDTVTVQALPQRPLMNPGYVSMIYMPQAPRQTHPPRNAGSQVPFMLYNQVHGQPMVYTSFHSTPYHPYPRHVSNDVQHHQQGAGALPQHKSQETTTELNKDLGNGGSDHEMGARMEEGTEGETSSSFYSSFLRTDSGSDDNQLSSDKDSVARNRTKCLKWVRGQNQTMYGDETVSGSRNGTQPRNDTQGFTIQNKRGADAPWMKTSEQVNSQLSQLYIDLNRLGLPSALHLAEGFTSSGSSGEEAGVEAQINKKRRPYSKMAMIYEEDAPFPPMEEPHCPQSEDLNVTRQSCLNVADGQIDNDEDNKPTDLEVVTAFTHKKVNVIIRNLSAACEDLN